MSRGRGWEGQMHGMWFSTGLALGPQGTDSWAGPGWASVSQTLQCRPEAQKDRVQKHQGVPAGASGAP